MYIHMLYSIDLVLEHYKIVILSNLLFHLQFMILFLFLEFSFINIVLILFVIFFNICFIIYKIL